MEKVYFCPCHRKLAMISLELEDELFQNWTRQIVYLIFNIKYIYTFSSLSVLVTSMLVKLCVLDHSEFHIYIIFGDWWGRNIWHRISANFTVYAASRQNRTWSITVLQMKVATRNANTDLIVWCGRTRTGCDPWLYLEV